MALISIFLKNVILDIRKETQDNYLFLPLLLILIAIPLPYAYSSISIGVFIGLSFLLFRKENLNFRSGLIYPVLIYVLMTASLFWTIDFSQSKAALFKVFPFLLLPVCFFINKPFTENQIAKIIRYFGYAYVLFALFYLCKALIRFLIHKDASVFFYHELVTQDVNAIHVSVYMALAFSTFVIQKDKTFFDKMSLVVLGIIIVLLSSKNVLVVFLILNGLYFFLSRNQKKRKHTLLLVLVLGLTFSAVFFKKIKERFEIEVLSNVRQNTVNQQLSDVQGTVYNVSVYEAWNNERFQQNDFFPGTALRVYQFRIFLEMMKESSGWLCGYGVNATKSKIREKRIEYDLYPGYDEFNFHNQYLQFFAELGVFGALLLLVMLGVSLKNALRNKDFVYISFSILMISLFLTESFLSRQRGIIFFMLFYCLFTMKKERFTIRLIK